MIFGTSITAMNGIVQLNQSIIVSRRVGGAGKTRQRRRKDEVIPIVRRARARTVLVQHPVKWCVWSCTRPANRRDRLTGAPSA